MPVASTITITTYGLGGFLSKAPNGNVVEIADQDLDANEDPVGEPRVTFPKAG